MELTMLRRELRALRAEKAAPPVATLLIRQRCSSGLPGLGATGRGSRCPARRGAAASGDAGNRQNQSGGDAGRTARQRAGVRRTGIGTRLHNANASTRRRCTPARRVEASEQRALSRRRPQQAREALLALHQRLQWGDDAGAVEG
ncbi:hypothetical protein M8494_16975 [Serratia ureilytica]